MVRLVDIRDRFRRYLQSAAGIIYSNALLVVSDKVVKSLIAVVMGALIARQFGPEEFGDLAYSVAFVALFQGFANLGMDAITVRRLSQDGATAPTVLGTVFALRLICGLVLWPIAVISVTILSNFNSERTVLVAFVGGALFFQAVETIDLWFQSQRQVARTVLAKLGVYLIGTIGRIGALWLALPIYVFALFALVDAIILSMGLIFQYNRFSAQGKLNFNKNLAKTLVLESWPFLLSGVSVLIYTRIDQIMIGEYLGSRALGIYSVVALISGFFTIIPVGLSTAVAPYVATLKTRSDEAYRRVIGQIYLAFLLMSLIIVLMVNLGSSFLINLLYGAQFSTAAAILNVHVASNLPLFLGVAQGIWLVNEQKGHVYLFKTASGLATCVLLNFYFIESYGLLGAAFVSVISHFVAAVVSNFIWDRDFVALQMDLVRHPSRYLKMNID